MNSGYYPVIVFIGVIATFFANNYLQKKIIVITNKEKAIDFIFENLKDYETLCKKYWAKATHDENYSLEIKIKYKQLCIFTKFAHDKYSLQDKQIIDTLLVRLFTESTGGDFDSTKRFSPQPEKIIKISKISNNIAVRLLKSKI